MDAQKKQSSRGPSSNSTQTLEKKPTKSKSVHLGNNNNSDEIGILESNLEVRPGYIAPFPVRQHESLLACYNLNPEPGLEDGREEANHKPCRIQRDKGSRKCAIVMWLGWPR